VNDFLLQVIDIHTYYGDAHVLEGVSFNVEHSACVAILGRNGVGKTTLARSLIGFSPPRRGRIVFHGAEIAGLASQEIVGLGMAIVPQGRRVFRSLTVEENLRIAAKKSNRKSTTQGWDLQRIYRLFPRLQERRQQRAHTLSGGEQQMLAIGRALMTCPTLLVLDEPTEGLAPIVMEVVIKALEELKRAGVSLLLLEQRVEVALRLADTAIAMGSRGSIDFIGPPEGFPGHIATVVPVSA
jgi:branched-chain amino acid transport system ATP-binding protein